MGNFDEEKYGGMERYANYFEGCRPKFWQINRFLKDSLSALNVFSIFVNLLKKIPSAQPQRGFALGFRKTRNAPVVQSDRKHRDFAPVASAPVAQLDRASDFESEGWGFKSLRVYKNAGSNKPASVFLSLPVFR